MYTTAQLLGAFLRDLLEQGIDQETANSIVKDAGRHLTGVHLNVSDKHIQGDSMRPEK